MRIERLPGGIRVSGLRRHHWRLAALASLVIGLAVAWLVR